MYLKPRTIEAIPNELPDETMAVEEPVPRSASEALLEDLPSDQQEAPGTPIVAIEEVFETDTSDEPPAPEKTPAPDDAGSGNDEPPRDMPPTGGEEGEERGEEASEVSEPSSEQAELARPNSVIVDRFQVGNTDVTAVLCEHTAENAEQIAAALRETDIVALEAPDIADEEAQRAAEQSLTRFVSGTMDPQEADDYIAGIARTSQDSAAIIAALQGSNQRVVLVDINKDHPGYALVDKSSECEYDIGEALAVLPPLEETRQLCRELAEHRTNEIACRDEITTNQLQTLLEETNAQDEPPSVSIMLGAMHYSVIDALDEAGVTASERRAQVEALVESKSTYRALDAAREGDDVRLEEAVDRMLIATHIASAIPEAPLDEVEMQVNSFTPQEVVDTLIALRGDLSDQEEHPDERYQKVETSLRNILEQHAEHTGTTPPDWLGVHHESAEVTVRIRGGNTVAVVDYQPNDSNSITMVLGEHVPAKSPAMVDALQDSDIIAIITDNRQGRPLDDRGITRLLSSDAETTYDEQLIDQAFARLAENAKQGDFVSAIAAQLRGSDKQFVVLNINDYIDGATHDAVDHSTRAADAAIVSLAPIDQARAAVRQQVQALHEFGQVRDRILKTQVGSLAKLRTPPNTTIGIVLGDLYASALNGLSPTIPASTAQRVTKALQTPNAPLQRAGEALQHNDISLAENIIDRSLLASYLADCYAYTGREPMGHSDLPLYNQTEAMVATLEDPEVKQIMNSLQMDLADTAEAVASRRSKLYRSLDRAITLINTKSQAQ